MTSTEKSPPVWLQVIGILAQVVGAIAIPVVLAWAGNSFANRQARADALQAYLDQMSQLMDKSSLRESQEGEVVRGLARARTLTVLRQLDTEGKERVLAFLYESSLINVYVGQPPPLDLPKTRIVALNYADLRGVDLRVVSGADLTGNRLSHIDLTFAYLTDANASAVTIDHSKLFGADLSEADLSEARLYETDLAQAILRDADLSNVSLGPGVNLDTAELQDADLSRVTIEKKARDKTEGVNLLAANLEGANLVDADLRYAKLVGARLQGASLQGVKLQFADLEGARGVTDEELQRQAASLEGATMPDGTVHD